MDDYNNPTSETPHAQPEGAAGTAARMKLSEKVTEVKRKKSPTSAARRSTTSKNLAKPPRAPCTRQQRNCIQVENKSPA